MVTEREAAQQRIAELEEKLEQTQRQLDLLVRQVFGKKSEQSQYPEPDQLELEIAGDEDEETGKSGEDAPAKPTKKKGGSRKGRQTRAQLLPKNLPVEETVIVPLVVQENPEKWRRIGEEVTERIERYPAKVVRLRVVRPTYVQIEQPYAAPVSAPAPPQLIEGGFLGPQLSIDLVLNKYLYHQPLYRQAQGLKWESEVELSLATLCQTIARVAEAVEPVVHCMADAMWKSGYVQFDLTPVRCLSREHDGGSFLGQMWVSSEVGGDVIYTWDKSKEAIVAERIVPAWFDGIIQADGGSELACFLKGGKKRNKPPPDITRAGCWTHVRRKFHQAAEAGCQQAKRLLKIINVLYRIERIAREGKLDAKQRADLRQRRSRRVVRGLHRRIKKVLQEVRPKSPVGRACLYTLGQWESLQVYLEESNGHVMIDNNGVENAIRPCALGKKNWLFIGDVRAGQRTATLYSLLGSCLRRAINPRDYLSWLFEHLPRATNLTVHTLTPAAYSAKLVGSEEAVVVA